MRHKCFLSPWWPWQTGAWVQSQSPSPRCFPKKPNLIDWGQIINYRIFAILTNISKYSTNPKFCKCTDRSHKCIDLLRKASSSYIFFIDFLWLKPLARRDANQSPQSQMIIRVECIKKKQLHASWTQGKTTNHLWNLFLGSWIFSLGKYEEEVYSKKRLSC